MKKIKAKTAEVLSKLKQNRATHRTTFVLAIDGYRTQAIAAFEENIQNAKDNKPFWNHLRLERPEDHTEDYDVAIQMLEWHEDEFIELDAQSVQHFIMDDWSWKEHFVRNTSSYTRS